ncbi:hydroxymethylglutaryl-CoA lyase [Natranaerofaba carboxydovora]|uniref:hydroxymethylglutaryl-CoA lyase n=1 Tax=Natranaerofaba carboxydovora TaxID=2742683 RepID=UPI001F136064|nr:hydroxymethylglutaryl-CoA lyase [Natranaerofaba carboxydovora]UMZ74691.1 Hydroxymethylglutaryl-CoA lyase YngG [Natranaerofaba carboxydovora]
MAANMNSELKLVEVTPRDGLQNEKEILSTHDKLSLVESLVEAGFKEIEVTSFVNPKFVPQMHDAWEIASKLYNKHPGVTFSALAPNEKGAAKAVEACVDQIGVFISATETHNQKNVNMSKIESLRNIEKISSLAVNNNIKLRGYIVVAFDCPYEGRVSFKDILEIYKELEECGIEEVSLGDTTGSADPLYVKEVVNTIKEKGENRSDLALHFHDSQGMGLANIFSAYQEGARIFDGSVGGVGGSPVTPGAGGNVAMEDMVNMFEKMEVKTDISLDILVDLAKDLENKLGRVLPGKLAKTWEKSKDYY